MILTVLSDSQRSLVLIELTSCSQVTKKAEQLRNKTVCAGKRRYKENTAGCSGVEGQWREGLLEQVLREGILKTRVFQLC